MDEAIKVLLIVLLLVTIVAVVKLIQLLRKVETTLDTTKHDINSTLVELNGVTSSTKKLMEEELAPTLQVARQTLENVQVTTRVLADVTQSAQRVTQKVESMVDTTRLVASGASLAKSVLGNVQSLFGRKSRAKASTPPAPVEESSETKKPVRAVKAKQ